MFPHLWWWFHSTSFSNVAFKDEAYKRTRQAPVECIYTFLSDCTGKVCALALVCIQHTCSTEPTYQELLSMHVRMTKHLVNGSWAWRLKICVRHQITVGHITFYSRKLYYFWIDVNKYKHCMHVEVFCKLYVWHWCCSTWISPLWDIKIKAILIEDTRSR